MNIIQEANYIINNMDIESMFKIINQDQDDHFNYHEGTNIFYKRKYAEYVDRNGKTFLMGFNIYAQNEGEEPFLLGTYDTSRLVMHVLSELYNNIESSSKGYTMPELEDDEDEIL